MTPIVVVPDILAAEIWRLHHVRIPVPSTVTANVARPIRDARDIAIAALLAGGWRPQGIKSWLHCGWRAVDKVQSDPAILGRGRHLAIVCHGKYLAAVDGE